MSERDRLVCVHKLNDPIEANLVRGLLLNEGIPFEITGEGLVGAYSGVPKLCEVRLLVPPGYKIAAERFLPDDVEQAVYEVPGVRRGCVAAIGHLPEGAGSEEALLLGSDPVGDIGRGQSWGEANCRHAEGREQ